MSAKWIVLAIWLLAALVVWSSFRNAPEMEGDDYGN